MRLSEDVIDNWYHFYNELIQFHKTYGHFNVPSDDEEHKELLEWMHIQKRAKHRLPGDFIDKLRAIGFDFSTNHQLSQWHEYFEALERFFMKHHHAHVPATDPQCASLHQWLITQIKNKDSLSKNQKDKLDSLGVHWGFESFREWKWHEMYLHLRAFYKEHSHCNVPQKWGPNPKLSSWVVVQRRSFAEGKMKKERKDKLNAMGFVWDFRKVYERQWEGKYNQLIEFKSKHGHCKVPVTYVDQQLARWVDRQRTLRAKGRLPENREQKLQKIDFIWNCDVLQEESWEERFNELKTYKKQYGDCQISVKWKGNPSLGIWVGAQRRLEKEGKLDPVKKEKLHEVGFVWSDEARKLQLKKYDQQWGKNYRRLKEYKKRYEEIQVSVSIDRPLEQWTCIQRKRKKTGKLSVDKIKKLEQIGFPWDIHESYWMHMYDQLVWFRKKYGHTRVPWRWEANPRLDQWVSRTRLKQYKLTEAQIALLNQIGFDWHVIRKNPVPWEEMIDCLAAFKSKYGHTRVPAKWETDRKLGKWVARQRSDQEKLKPERKKMLEQIGFDWQKGRKGRQKKKNEEHIMETCY
jgi:hypothetical protein